MKSKTKIIVLHMKEIIYTIIFAALGIQKNRLLNLILNVALLKLTLLHKHSKNATCRVCTAKKPQSILSVAF